MSKRIAGRPVHEIIGRNVKIHRHGSRMQQKRLLETMRQAGVPFSQATLSKIERGHRSLKLAEAVVLADALDCTLDDLAKDVAYDPEARS